MRDPHSLFSWLGGPAVIVRPGTDRSRVRLVAGSVHGNEPSGAHAITHLLSRSIPATDLILVCGAVHAALALPPFSHRMLPGHRDLNRCFRGPVEGAAGDESGAVAHALLEAIADARAGRVLEAAIDVHNTTGDNPDFVITGVLDDAHAALARLCSPRTLAWRLQLGTLAEVLDETTVAVTLECGRAQDPAADARARAAAERFASLTTLPTEAPAEAGEVYRDPTRVRLKEGLSVAFGDPARGGDVDLMLDASIDRHNFTLVPRGTVLGVVRDGVSWPLVCDGDDRRDGPDPSTSLFAIDARSLITATPFVPLMMTTNAAVARSDCLFYCCVP